MGLGTKPPPQFGHTLCNLVSTHSAQKVHSYEQMRAVVASGASSLSQYSQFGRSCSAMVTPDHPSVGIFETMSKNFGMWKPIQSGHQTPPRPLIHARGSHSLNGRRSNAALSRLLKRQREAAMP